MATCGGIEILLCVPQTKDLRILHTNLSAQALKEAMAGSQGKIFVRPIQKNLDVKSQSKESSSNLKGICLTCKKELFLRDMRSHNRGCRYDQMSSTSVNSSSDNQSKIDQPNVNDQVNNEVQNETTMNDVTAVSNEVQNETHK